MDSTNGIIKPLRAPTGLYPGFQALMVSHPADLEAIRKRLDMDGKTSRRVLMSRLYWRGDLAVIGPFMGAPYAVALLEHLIAWGVEKIVCYGWCGAISPDVAIGDLVIPTKAKIDEGTSGCYFLNGAGGSLPDPAIQENLRAAMDITRARTHAGAVWSTDGLFQETPEKIARYRSQGVLAVEMEASALFTVSNYRSVALGCLLVVSDGLSSGEWTPGFSDRGFKNSRDRVCQHLPAIFEAEGAP
ncbi:MAG: nucleoside phosphorylase [Desulfobacterales bacterium]|nr:nucleoside phosphorylase [Desulfobacterales bacterium]